MNSYRKIGNILLFIALGAIAVAIPVIVYDGVSPISAIRDQLLNSLGTYLIGPVVVCIVVGLILRHLHGFGVFRGPVTWGRITNTWQTRTGNNFSRVLKLEVEYTTQDGQTIRAKDWVNVALINFPAFSLGAMVPLKYNPASPENIKILRNIDSAREKYGPPNQNTINQQFGDQASSQQQNGTAYTSLDDLSPAVQSAVQAALSSLGGARQKVSIHISKPQVTVNGTPKTSGGNPDADATGRVRARGVVLSSQPTGNIINDEAEITLHLKVTRPDDRTYEATVTKPVPQYALNFTQPGSVVHVLYMPYDEQNIVVGFFA